jgi:TolB-like protein
MTGLGARSTFAFLCLVLALAWSRHNTRAASDPIRVAVIEFESATSAKELAPLGKGLQSMLTTDLTGIPGVQVIERQQLKDVLAELDLGKSGLKAGRMDKSTIAKIGKLAGASRLLGGSFTVVGGKMRLDGRLYAVETGEVLMAASIDGEKDAFFELEKQLAHKIVNALGIVLKPKERAALAKVQTADFEAFQSFSRGLAAFDEKRYQDALAALGDASRRDKDFALAARTLDEYEKLIGDLRRRAETMTQTAEAETDARVHRQQAANSAKWGATIDALWRIAGQSGGGQTQLDRLAATFLLAKGYESRFEFHWGDRFAFARTADELEKRYFLEAKDLFPHMPPFVALGDFNDPDKNESVEAWVRRTVAALKERMSPARAYSTREAILEEVVNAKDGRGLVVRLRLDGRSSLRLTEQLLAWVDALDPKHEIRSSYDGMMAEFYRKGLELERSTATFVAASKHSGNRAPDLNWIARELEKNKKIVKILENAKNPLVKESLLLEGLNEEVVSKYLSDAVPTKEGLRHMAYLRRLSGFMYVDEVPVWTVHIANAGDMLTGPCNDRVRTSELRYYPDVGERRYDPEALMVTGARPRRDGTVNFKVSFTPATDVWRREVRKGQGQADSSKQRPQVGVAFGIQSAFGYDPTTGYVLFLGASELEVARFILKERELVTTTIAKQSYEGLAGTQAVVMVRFVGKTAEVTVGGRKTSVEIPTERDGFQGLFFRKLGYMAISHLMQN